MSPDMRAEDLQVLAERVMAGTPVQVLLDEGAVPDLVRLATLAVELNRELPSRPSPAFRGRLQADLQADMLKRHRAKRVAGPWRWLAPRLAAGLLAVAFVLGSAVAASAATLPGDSLYPVKRASEAVLVRLAWSHEARAAIQLQIAEARLAELRGLGQSARPVLAELGTAMAAAQEAALTAAMASGDGALLAQVTTEIDRQRAAIGEDAGGPEQPSAVIQPPVTATWTATAAAVLATPTALPVTTAVPIASATPRSRPAVALPTETLVPLAPSATLPAAADEPSRPARTLAPPPAATEATAEAPLAEATLSPGEARAATRAADATRAASVTDTPEPTASPRWPPPRPTRSRRMEPTPPSGPRDPIGPSRTPPPTAAP